MKKKNRKPSGDLCACGHTMKCVGVCRDRHLKDGCVRCPSQYTAQDEQRDLRHHQAKFGYHDDRD